MKIELRAADGLTAGLPRDAFVLVEAFAPQVDGAAFATNSGEMYSSGARNVR